MKDPLKTSNQCVRIDELDQESWIRWVHEGPCCSHPKSPEEQDFGHGPSGTGRKQS